MGSVAEGGTATSSARRPKAPDGQRIGSLDDAKPNADVFLSRVEELLRERFGVSQVIGQRKRYSGHPAEDVDDPARRCQVVVNGVDD